VSASPVRERAPHPVARHLAGGLPAWSFGGRYLAGLLALTCAYFGAARLGYALEFSGPVAAIVWLPAGVGIAFLTLGGPAFWPGVLIGDLLANDYSLLPLGSALGQTAGNMAEVLVASLLIRRLVARGPPPLDSLGGILRLVAIMAGATAISATLGPLSLLAGDVIAASELPKVAQTWWLGDAAGALVVIPLALAWYRPRPRGYGRSRAVEAVLMIAAVAVMSEIAFRTENPLAYLVFPTLGWAALRFGRRGATLAIAVAVGFAVWNTTHYHGPFVVGSVTLSVLTTQLYVAVVALSTLGLAALVSERSRFAEGLLASRARLVEASDAERRRLERNLHDGAQQRLSALAARLGLAAELAREDRDPAAAVLEDAGAEVGLAIDELRELSHGILPPVLSDLGLARALRAMARRSSVPVTFVGKPPTARFDDIVEATAYYVFAEALTNTQKHARASSVRVRLTATNDAVQLEIADDGVGGATEAAGGGLAGLRDRVEALDGSFGVDSPGGRGTRVRATLPRHRPRRRAAALS
jgi:signal transduction histidine kinase